MGVTIDTGLKEDTGGPLLVNFNLTVILDNNTTSVVKSITCYRDSLKDMNVTAQEISEHGLAYADARGKVSHELSDRCLPQGPGLTEHDPGTHASSSPPTHTLL